MGAKGEARLYGSVFHVELAPVSWSEELAWNGHGRALSNRECVSISNYNYEGVSE